MKIVIDRKKCRASGECVTACPENAISIVDGVATIDESKCDLDGICIPACPHGAIGFSEGITASGQIGSTQSRSPAK